MVDRQRIIDLLIQHEGIRLKAYKDSRGFLTIGIGFNLDAPGASGDCQACGLNYGALRIGQQITREQAEALLQIGIQRALDVATIIVKGFQELPANAQLVIVDMLFNLGSKGFSEFRNTIAALEAHNWIGAAEGMTNSAWYHQTGNRAKDDINLILHAGD